MTHKCNKEEEITRIQIDTTETKQRVKVIEKRLFGNGVKGLVEKWDEIVTFITTYKEDIKKVRPALDLMITSQEKGKIEKMSRSDMLKWTLAIGTILLGSFVGFLFWIIQFSIKKALGG